MTNSCSHGHGSIGYVSCRIRLIAVTGNRFTVNRTAATLGVAPAAGSSKKRLRISDSDGEDDVKPAGGDDEGDGKELTEADLRRREGEQYS